MKSLLTFLTVAVLFASLAEAQQTSQISQPAQTQAQTAPCPTGPSQAATPQKSGASLTDRWKKKINDVSTKFGTKTGVPMPTTEDFNGLGSAKSAPCPPKAVTSATSTVQPAPVPHLPTGVITTWLCNPIITSTDPSHTTTFITPDVLTNAEPAQSSVFEADGAKADPKAIVSCANLRRDPKNNKVFLAQ